MYRVGVIINENEVSHSKFADTLAVLQSAISECNEGGKKGNSFFFIAFDKFDIQDLFDVGEKNIMTFDAIFIATNAMGNERIYDAFCANKDRIEDFLNTQKGMFISSQKKLSNGSLNTEKYKSTGFLPEAYDYFLFDRPEKYSADGEVSISSTDKILLYPYKITNGIIKDHCENNDFIVHRYRSVIIPKHKNAYENLLKDISKPISQTALGYLNGDRNLLLSSRYNNRIVVSSMALDWANHVELLCNILIFITEDKAPAIFIKKKTEQQNRSSIIDSYAIRANISKLPFRVVLENEIEDYLNYSVNTFIFSPKWTTDEVEKQYAGMLDKQNKYFSVYHICAARSNAENELKLIKYCNFSSVDQMKDNVMRNIISGYLSNSWYKSVWTYNYIIKLVSLFDIDIKVIASKLYLELGRHFTKTSENGVEELVGSYDNVFNATCQMAEVLYYLQEKYGNTIYHDFQYHISDVLQHAESWIISKVETDSVRHQDVFYCVLYFLKNRKYHFLDDSIKSKLEHLIKEILNEIQSNKAEYHSSIDLGRIYQTICLLVRNKIFVEAECIPHINWIESILVERQNIYGNWKNISETAEIATMLLEVYEENSTISNSISVSISKAIELLHSQFDPITNVWSDDLNTTSKAMYAISKYDRIFNFAINDFFLDLNHHQTNIAKMPGSDFKALGAFYNSLDSLEKENMMLDKKLQSSAYEILVGKKKLSRNRRYSQILFSMFLSALSLAILIFTVLLINHRNVLEEISKDWTSWFISAIIGLIITIAWSVIYNKFNKTISE